MNTSPERQRLFSFDFIAMCLLIFFTYCNTTVFYSLDVYLGLMGIGQQWRGFLIGSSSLATLASFLLFTPKMTARIAVPCACLGSALFIACGVSFLYASSAGALLALRIVNGISFYLLSASVMTMLVRIIPPERSGQAFGLYSIAILLPYSIVPAAFDSLFQGREMLAKGYMTMSLSLVPALALLLVIHARNGRGNTRETQVKALAYKDMLKNMANPPIAMVLGFVTLYITTFAAVYFMAKAFLHSRGVENVGTFFTLQMVCMILVRFLGSRHFDRISKILLIRLCFILTAASCLMLAAASSTAWMYVSAVIMGLGMGIGAPAMNSLMFGISAAEHKAINSNLVTMSQQLGNFAGPMLGAVAVHQFGYTGFLLLGAGACLSALALCSVFVRHRRMA